MTRIDDETLIAFVDGELDPARRAQVEAAIAADPQLRTAVEQQQRLRAAVTGAFAPVVEEPVPAALLAAVGGETRPAQVIDLAAERARRHREPAAPQRPSWHSWGAIAATLVVGIVAGQMADFGPTPQIAAQDGVLVAQGRLATALDEQLASAPTGGPVRVGLSFRDKGGSYCRTFTEAEGLSGVACREGNGWGVRMAVASGAAPAGTYRMASSETPPAILVAVGEMIVGDTLDATQEKAARDSGWR